MTTTTTRPVPSHDATTQDARRTRGPRRAARPVWLVVALREMTVKLRDKGFLISTLVTLGFIVGAVALQVYFVSTANTITVATAGAGADDLVDAAVAAADAAGQDVTIDTKPLADEAAVDAAVLDGSAAAGLVAEDGRWRLVGKTDRNEIAEVWIGSAIQAQRVAANAADAGTSLDALYRGADVEFELLDPSATPTMTARISTYAFGFLFYLATVLLGGALASSVVEEKQNRIVEIIASSVHLRDILLGKIVGCTVMALAQMGAFAIAVVGGLAALGEREMLSHITPGLGWFLVFYTVGVTVLACVYATAGAMATRSEDIQSATTPISIGVGAVFIIGFAVSGTLLKVLSFVPIVSTVTMPGRIVAGGVAWWEPVAALAAALAVAVLVLLVGERVYRRALLQTGGRLTVRQALSIED